MNILCAFLGHKLLIYEYSTLKFDSILFFCSLVVLQYVFLFIELFKSYVYLFFIKAKNKNIFLYRKVWFTAPFWYLRYHPANFERSCIIRDALEGQNFKVNIYFICSNSIINTIKNETQLYFIEKFFNHWNISPYNGEKIK